ncbi:MAG: protein translocase subunit SecD [Armatimonadetes bacterium]|nr:protein translocase subunit SecD [Armatimonadota bacterium]
MDNKTWGLVILGLLIAALVVLADPWKQWPTKEGLDIAGGVRVVMELQPTQAVKEINAETQQQVINVLDRRVNALGVSEPVIQPKANNQVIVELAERSKDKQTPLDKNSAIQTLIKTAQLEFIYLKDVESEKNPFGRYKFNTAGNTFTDRQTNRTLTQEEVEAQILYNDRSNIIMTGRNLMPGRAQATFSPEGGTVVTLELDREGTEKFRDFTSKHVKEQMAIVYDRKVQSAPVIQEEIPGGQVQITLGQSPLKEAVEMADLLNAGALPVPLKIVQMEEVEASLGQDAVQATKMAGILGLALICVFMVAFYFLPGVVAVLALFFYAVITFAAFKLLGVVLTLPGIAGFILSVGMAVDANVLIFERMKEEMRAGRTIHTAIDTGFRRAYPSIRDSNLATIITSAILWMFGTGPVKGFALVLALGVAISFFTAITVSRTLLHLIVTERMANRPALFGVTRGWVNRAGRTQLNFIKHRWLYFGISLGLILPGIVFLAMGGLRPGIEFTGGSAIQYSFAQRVSPEQIRQTFQTSGIEDVQIQLTEGTVQQQDAFVRTEELTPEQRVAAFKALQTKFPNVKELSYSLVGPSISRELVKNAFLAVVYASVLILIFLAWQFQSAGFKTGLKYGVCAIIALIHDVLLLLGIFAIMGYYAGWQVDSLFVTAVLTVIGFSVHDTIVIFDRVRENWRNRAKDANFGEIINRSINETLTRSINTGITVLLVLFALLFLGGAGLKLFVVAMLIGIIAGTYSSIFNASQLLYLWDRRGTGERLAEVPGKATTPDVKRRPSPATGAAPTAAGLPPTAGVPAADDGADGDGATTTTPASAPGASPRPTAPPAGTRAQVRPKRKKRF